MLFKPAVRGRWLRVTLLALTVLLVSSSLSRLFGTNVHVEREPETNPTGQKYVEALLESSSSFATRPSGEAKAKVSPRPASRPTLPHPTSRDVGTPDGELPTLCSWVSEDSTPARFPGYNFCPAPRIEYMMQHHRNFAPRGDSSAMALLGEMLYLDALFMLGVIKKAKYQLSMHVVNLGANPSSPGQDQHRKVVPGDDTTELNYAGWYSMNYDVPQMSATTNAFYSQFAGRAQVDTTGTVTPAAISDDLKQRGVPTDVDFLKIDIDSFECEYLEAILAGGFQPKVIDVELASSYPPPIRFRAKFTTDVNLAATPFGGCSLQEAVEILKPYEYTLVQYPLEDGWFVQNKYLDLFGPVESDPTTLFYRGNPFLYGAWQLFRGTEGVLAAMKSRVAPEALLTEIKKAHEVVLASRPQLRGRAKFTLSL
mmetsp:Transcript_25799/g.63475  ORF Transcript_25799/g.63475 Transcript_25799/m.63475 type:complete len:425 (+) Transcript_25799:256-1530(+)|eukprot:CAMPEP_0197590886 /NCGR_PEP_ID=MMETSP1326-20131121/12269_1 /TAXON_ID=1155430 /ORGANISM="Genus nov. species nov., Strain RCC2288" /LENGTH=424 /DNA_ID=CAMNT_0043156183 /DNA_START=233 /DNA_END=1507 /DNA_ORIENTATION=+